MGLVPNLHGIVGKAVASAEGYQLFRSDERRKGGVWEEATLDAYIENPRKAIARWTKMAFAGISNAEERKGVDRLSGCTEVSVIRPPRKREGLGVGRAAGELVDLTVQAHPAATSIRFAEASLAASPASGRGE